MWGFVETNTSSAGTATQTLPVVSVLGFAIYDRLRVYDAVNGEQFVTITGITGNNISINKAITFTSGADVEKLNRFEFSFFAGWKIGVECSSITTIRAIYRETR